MGDRWDSRSFHYFIYKKREKISSAGWSDHFWNKNSSRFLVDEKGCPVVNIGKEIPLWWNEGSIAYHLGIRVRDEEFWELFSERLTGIRRAERAHKPSWAET